ncbi:hypothetical protein SDRG_00960 [Saprolegnia diclina VS20]|uniref:Uncharacterized protein n=1 Tax=Saprolegnia diclina (strain VS20) TaxID=1156394 RepID=T0R6N3_SAPDV|nr:hypothetical protein SDRG_00960 [Saprolegnia diclina VS20]EQC42120.1 hypothetical protein SDRG_00960 [Saprolegnia diclina VS20]|eukprot:XP_008604689.1 hypothetical protein SDRG_00960 [Saprolegnia diclina VS20]
MQQSYTLKALDQVTGPWSSQSLFWMPLNDLYCGMTMNRSFVRGTSRFFGANISALPAINLEAWQGIKVLSGVTKALHESLGPYLSIDSLYIAPPNALVSAVSTFQHTLRTELDGSTYGRAELLELSVNPQPLLWRNLTFYGGDPSCTSSSSSSFVQDQFGFFNDCTRVIPFGLILTEAHLLWAAWVTAQPLPSSICTYSTAIHCVTSIAAATSLQANLPPLPDALVSTLRAATQGVNIMQFASSSNATMQLLTQPLLPHSDKDDDVWTVFGWCLLHDWAMGTREVVSFQGDVASMTLLSSAYDSQAHVTSNAALQVATSHLYYVVLASSCVLVVLGGILLLHAIHCGFRLHSSNLWRFNRLAGGVWLGRALMAFRGLTALVLQSTSQLALRRQNSDSFLVLAPRSWLDTAIVASEATWLSYSLHELLLVGWPNAIVTYGPTASLALWVVLCALDVALPVLPVASIQRTCVGNDMDYGLACSAGSLEVGSLARFLFLLGLELVAAIVPAVLGGRRRRPPSAAHQSLLLPAVSQAFLVPVSTHGSTITVDKASCVLVGLLPFRWFGVRYVFALRSWTLLLDSTSIGDVVLLEGHAPNAGAAPMVADDAPGPTRLLYRARRVVAAAGFVYMVSSIVSSVSFLEISRVNLSNDFFWPNFNVTGHHARIGGGSLLRNSARFAFQNTTLQVVLTDSKVLNAPLSAGLSLITHELGPFGVIDTVYMPVPTLVSALVRAILRATRSVIAANSTAQADFLKIATLSASYPIPRIWGGPNYASFGGSPLCAEYSNGQPVGTAGFSSLPSFDFPCSSSSSAIARIIPTRQHYLTSAVLSGLGFKTASQIDVPRTCVYDANNKAACAAYVTKTLVFVTTYLTGFDASTIASVHAALLTLDIRFMLYARLNTTSPLTLLHTPVLDLQDANFWFFGYMYLYDWVLGYREVVSFQGDVGTLTLLSDLQPALLQQVPTDLVTTNAAVYCRLAVSYVSCVMLLVATLATGYLVRSRNHVEGLNMFELCRVGGIVWVGRPLLLLRSLTAVALLSTVSIDLVRVGSVSMFYTVATPWHKVALAATEVTWLSAIVTDLGLVATQTYASYYVTLNSALVWVSVATLTLFSPVTAQMTLARQCALVDVDFDVRCDSGSLGIGSFPRFLQLVLLVVAWNVLSFLAVRRLVGPPPALGVRSHLLSANARYLYNHSLRTHGDVYYLDRASAAIDGILTLRRRDSVVALDLKLWRCFITHIATTTHAQKGGPRADLTDAYPIMY